MSEDKTEDKTKDNETIFGDDEEVDIDKLTEDEKAKIIESSEQFDLIYGYKFNV